MTLLKSQEKFIFDNVYNSGKDGIAIVDLESNFLDFNPAYMNLTGFSRNELLQKSCVSITAPEERANILDAIDQVIENGEVDEFEKTCLVKDDSRIQVVMSLALLPNQKEILIRIADISEQKKLLHRLENAYETDQLTGLPNRSCFQKLLKSKALSAADQTYFFCLLDINDFSAINQLYGRENCDKLLIELTQRIKDSVHSDELIARIGGDSFLMLYRTNNAMHFKERMNKLLNNLDKKYRLPNSVQEIELCCSIGAVKTNSDQLKFNELIQQADHAMKRAKHPSRDAIVYVDKQTSVIQTQSILVKVSQAIKNGQMQLYYQPKIDLTNGEIIGLEAVVRWHCPERGILPAKGFIPQIRNTPVMNELDNWVLETVFKKAQQHYKQGYSWPVSVNISNRKFLHPNFINSMATLIRNHPELPRFFIEIEIPETIDIIDFDHTKDIILKGHALGLRFAIDKYGSGNSSISFLKKLPLNTVKIDKMFIKNMLSHASEMLVVEAIIELTNIFKINVIAEGVESIEQGVVLQRYGCNLAQGNGIAKAMLESELISWAKDYNPDPNWMLWANAKWDLNDLPLLVAKSDHLTWIEQAILMVKNRQFDPDTINFTDEYNCRFGKWYYSKSSQKYKQMKAFLQIEDLHREVHNLVRSMLQMVKLGDQDSAEAQIEKLTKLRDQILRSLDFLQKEFISQKIA